MNLTFSVDRTAYDRQATVDLIPNGRDIGVWGGVELDGWMWVRVWVCVGKSLIPNGLDIGVHTHTHTRTQQP